jgi:potassium channel subfamily K
MKPEPPNDEEASPLIVKRGAAAKQADSDSQSERRRWLVLGVASLALVVVGVVAGMFIEGWQMLTALYFVIQIVTTIGYGDVTPTADITKVFTAIYVLCSLVIIANFFHLFTEYMVRVQSDFIRKRLRAMEKMVFHNNNHGATNTDTQVMTEGMHEEMRTRHGAFQKMAAATVAAVLSIIFGMIFYATYEACSCSYGKTLVKGCSTASYDTCKSTGGNVHTWSTAFYMSVVTLTTVGFGDHTPSSRLGRGIGVVWMLTGVASVANWVFKLTEYFLQERLDKQLLQKQEEVTQASFQEIDRNGDGRIDRDEYRTYILLKHGLISRADLDIIDSHFNMLDRERTGAVTWDAVEKAQEITNRRRTMR